MVRVSLAVFAAWQSWHSDCRLAQSYRSPPDPTLTMWSTSTANARHPHRSHIGSAVSFAARSLRHRRVLPLPV